MTESLLAATPQEQQLDPAQDREVELAKTVKIMEHLHATEIFGTPESSKAFLDSLDYDGFKKYISFVNGVERGIPATERGKTSDSSVSIDMGILGRKVTYSPPHQLVRDSLLNEAFKKAQSIDDPEMAGVTLGLSINAIHYFADGNGRVARLMYALLSKGYDGSPESQKYYSSLLKETSGRDIVDLDPTTSGIDRKIIGGMFSDIMADTDEHAEVLDHHTPTRIVRGYADNDINKYRFQPDLQYDNDHDLAIELMSFMIVCDPKHTKDFVEISQDGTCTVKFDALLATLSEEDAKQYRLGVQALRYEYVKRIIDIANREDATEVAAHYSDKNT